MTNSLYMLTFLNSTPCNCVPHNVDSTYIINLILETYTFNQNDLENMMAQNEYLMMVQIAFKTLCSLTGINVKPVSVLSLIKHAK